MRQVYVKYNPYKLETVIKIEGQEIKEDSTLRDIISTNRRMQEWITDFPKRLKEELHTNQLFVEFCGMELDWEDFYEAFQLAKEKGIIEEFEWRFTKVERGDDVTEKIIEVFQDLQEGPIEEFKDEKLKKIFNNINQDIFPINVIATMSSGKSTLINALLRKKLMPSKNEACTATITEILDKDDDRFKTKVYGEHDILLEEVEHLTYEEMERLNGDDRVRRISVVGDIPFVESGSTSLMLVDTPGPNNSRDESHKEATYRALNSSSNNLILYVLNGTQLSTNDDKTLLEYVAEQMKKGGKQVRDRFLFVINKMDVYNPEEESIEKAIASVKEYLEERGIEEPQIYPCSAFTALNARNYLTGIDIDNLTRQQERQLPVVASDAINYVYKLVDFDDMHLEKYTTLSPSGQRKLERQLEQAIEREDTVEQGLIHSGIYSIESAINSYVTKYAKTKKIKDLVESFYGVLEEKEVFLKLKDKIQNSKEEGERIRKRAKEIEERINKGKEAESFTKKIDKLNPMSKICKLSDNLQREAIEEVIRIFEKYEDVVTSKEMARVIIKRFADKGVDISARIGADLNEVIHKEIVTVGKKMLEEYKEKLCKLDKNASVNNLDFSTVDLIKGSLGNMKHEIENLCSGQFETDTIDEIGTVTYKEEIYYEKVGEKEEEIIVGSHQEKIGTRQVKVGSEEKKVGTKMVRNYDKRWFEFWKPSKIAEDIFEMVDVYKTEDVFKTVLDRKTVKKDIMEQRVRRTEEFSLELSELQTKLLSKLRERLDDNIKEVQENAEQQVVTMKQQFKQMFTKIDELVKQRYKELAQCTEDSEKEEREYKKNKEILGWLEQCKRELDEIIEF